MNKRNVVSIMFLGLLFGFILIIVLLFTNRKVDNYSNLKIVNDYTLYFSAVENTDNFVKALSSQEKMNIYYLLDSNYIKKKRVNKSNVLDKVGEYEKDLSFVGDKVYYIEKENNYIYLVKGNLINEEQEVVVKNYKVGLVIDFDSLLVSFYPLEKEEDIDYITNIKIGTNSYNSLVPTKAISTENMCKLYYGYFIELVNNDINGLYNIMDDSIKNNYSIESFSAIVKNRYNNYEYNLNKCDIEESENERLFKIFDNKNNEIKIYEKGVMNYKINLNLN